MGLLVLAAALRLPTLGAQSYWYDESFTVDLLHHGLAAMLRLIPGSESTPPLYYIVAWLWTRPLGTGEVGLRSLSALAGIATVPLVWRTAWEVSGQRAALAAGALVAAHPLLVWYSQEGRAYALLVALVALCLLAFVRALQRPTPLALAAWALAAALALATHYFAAFLVGAQAIWLLATAPPRRRVAAVAAVAGLVLAMVALLPVALRERASGNANWIGHLGLRHRLGQLGHDFLVGLGPTLPAPVVGMAAMVAAIGLGLTAAGRGAGACAPTDRVRPDGAAVCLALAALAIVLPLVGALAGVDYVLTRNLLVALPPLAVALAAGLTGPGAGRWGLAGVGMLVLAGVAATVAVARSPQLQRPDWGHVAAVLGPAPYPRVMVVAGAARARPLLLYLSKARDLPPKGAAVTEIDVVGTRVRRRRACWWGAFCNIPPRPAPVQAPVAGFRPAGRAATGLFEIARFRSSSARPVTPAAVGLRVGSVRSPAVLLQRAPS